MMESGYCCGGPAGHATEYYSIVRSSKHTHSTLEHAVALRSGDPCTVTVIIPSYNTRDLLRNCLASVARQAEDCALQVVVVDNASIDGSADMVAAEFPAFRLLRGTRNLGYSGGANAGLALIEECDLTVILNSDTIVHDGAFAALCQAVSARANVGAACPLCVYADGTPQSYGWPILGATDFARQMAFLPSALPPLDASVSGYVESASGACLCLTREGMRAFGRFDERLVIYLEEQDVARRLLVHGLRCFYVSTAVVTHFGGRSTAQLDRTALFAAIHRSHAYFYGKHFGTMIGLGLRAVSAAGMSLRLANSLRKLLMAPAEPERREAVRARFASLLAYLGVPQRSLW